MKHLSLEVAISIIALAHLASSAMGVTLPWEWYVIVPVATWSLYTFDRLYDVRNANNRPDTTRHSFHYRYRYLLGILALILGISAAVMAALVFPFWYWYVAAGLGVLLVVHATMQKSASNTIAILKDVNVAVTFTVAAWAIPAIMRLQDGAPFDMSLHLHSIVHSIGVFAALLALVMADVVLLSRLDVRADSVAGMPSIAVYLGVTKSTVLIAMLLITAIILSVVLWFESGSGGFLVDGHLRPAAILLVMSTLYSLYAIRAPRNPDHARLLFECTLFLGLLA